MKLRQAIKIVYREAAEADIVYRCSTWVRAKRRIERWLRLQEKSDGYYK